MTVEDKYKIDNALYCSDLHKEHYLIKEWCPKYKKCSLCPSHGICSDGKLTCQIGYVREG